MAALRLHPVPPTRRKKTLDVIDVGDVGVERWRADIQGCASSFVSKPSIPYADGQGRRRPADAHDIDPHGSGPLYRARRSPVGVVSAIKIPAGEMVWTTICLPGMSRDI
jgi:hypothetical protein